jgi:hypothetical protein
VKLVSDSAHVRSRFAVGPKHVDVKLLDFIGRRFFTVLAPKTDFSIVNSMLTDNPVFEVCLVNWGGPAGALGAWRYKTKN